MPAITGQLAPNNPASDMIAQQDRWVIAVLGVSVDRLALSGTQGTVRREGQPKDQEDVQERLQNGGDGDTGAPITNETKNTGGESQGSTTTSGDKVRQALQAKLEILGGWVGGALPNAGEDHRKCTEELNKLASPVTEQTGYAAVANAIAKALAGWREVRLHRLEMERLDKEFASVKQIPVKDLESGTLKPQWGAYLAAKQALTDTKIDSITTTDKLPDLTKLRTDYAAAGRALCMAFEKNGAPSNLYYLTTKIGLDHAVSQAVRQATVSPARVPTETWETATLKEEIAALNKSISDLHPKIMSGDADARKQAVAMQRQIIEKSCRLCESPKDEAEIKLLARYRKVEAMLRGTAELGRQDGAGDEPKKFTEAFDAFLAKIKSKDEDRIKICGQLLDRLIEQLEKNIDEEKTKLKAQVSALVNRPAGGSTGHPSLDLRSQQENKIAKAAGAVVLINGAKPEILARLSVNEQLDLLTTLRAAGMPTFPKTAGKGQQDQSRGNTRRTAMRRLYQAMPLEPAFETDDKAKRKLMVEKMKEIKQELKDARKNWEVMTDKEKETLLTSVAKIQSEVFGFTLPTNGIHVETVVGGSSGGYTPSDLGKDPWDPAESATRDRIRINSAGAKSFETMLDTVLHENTHRQQNVLVRAVRYPRGDPPNRWLTETCTDPPYTQTRMFDAGNRDGGYVPPEEDQGVYEQQPEERHAWMSGGQGARAIMDMLDED